MRIVGRRAGGAGAAGGAATGAGTATRGDSPGASVDMRLLLEQGEWIVPRRARPSQGHPGVNPGATRQSPVNGAARASPVQRLSGFVQVVVQATCCSLPRSPFSFLRASAAL